MKMRRTDHKENVLDVVRLMVVGKTPQASKSVMNESVASALFEAMDGKSAHVQTKDCPSCGGSATMRVVIPRHGVEQISRCSSCGQNNQPGANTVRGSSNYTGGATYNYDN